MDFIGTADDDIISGTDDPDTFDMTQGGKDRVFGGNGSDAFDFGSKLTDKDRIDGGFGDDTLTIDGNYSDLVFKTQTMTRVEHLVVASGHSYNITIADETAAGIFAVDGSALGVGETLTFDGSADGESAITALGGAGDDVLTTGGSGDTLSGGAGNDVLSGGIGADSFSPGDGSDVMFGGTDGNAYQMLGFFDATDVIHGEEGFDTVSLTGDYGADLTITKMMMQDVENLNFLGAFDYHVTFENRVVGSGGTLGASASSLAAGYSAFVDGSAERTGNFNFTDSLGDDRFIGGDGGDAFTLSNGGNDIAEGGDGGESFFLGGSLTRDDRIDGGDGFDILFLNGDYSSGIEMRALTLVDLEQITFSAGHAYDFTMHDNNVAAGLQFRVFGSALGPADTLSFDGRAELDGTFLVEGGSADDVIIGSEASGVGDVLKGFDGNDSLKGGRGDDQFLGGIGDDTITGGRGADFIDAGTGSNVFRMLAVSDSTGSNHDIISHMDPGFDKFDLDFAVTGVDSAITTGSASTATFDADLAAAVDAAHLARHHAVLFTADGGDLNEHTFLVIDFKGGAGYQSGKDIVIDIDDAVNLTILTTNFI